MTYNLARNYSVRECCREAPLGGWYLRLIIAEIQSREFRPTTAKTRPTSRQFSPTLQNLPPKKKHPAKTSRHFSATAVRETCVSPRLIEAPLETISEYHSIIVLRGALNLAPIMPKDAKVSRTAKITFSCPADAAIYEENFGHFYGWYYAAQMEYRRSTHTHWPFRELLVFICSLDWQSMNTRSFLNDQCAGVNFKHSICAVSYTQSTKRDLIGMRWLIYARIYL